MSKNKSMKYQAQGILKPMLKLGESRQEAKQNSPDRQHVEGIFSTSTYKNYVTAADQFGRWAKAAYGEKILANCRQYVPEYLKTRIEKGLSPYTIDRDVSALAKLYKCTGKDFRIEKIKKVRSEITRSRIEVKGFDYEKHKALLDFINGTSHRRSELLKSKKENYSEVNGEIIVRIKGKGGKIRYTKVLPQYMELVKARLEGLNDGDKVFSKSEVPVRAPCHAYRAKYAQDYYNMIARPIDTLTTEEKYICRKDKRGIIYDRQALAEALPTSTPEASLMEGMLEAIAEFYSKQLSQNILRGMNYNAQNALYNGHKMLGYSVGEDKKYIVDPVTAPIVQKIFSDYASGKPIKKIVSELNSQGLKTVLGKEFTINSLRHILKNRAYIGEYHFSDVVIPKGLPALVSEEMFDRAQERFKLNMHKAKTNDDEEPEFWLTGKLYCGECGSSMHGISGTSKQGTKHYYYACKESRKHKCKLKAVQKELVEEIVIRTLEEFLKDSEMLASLAVDISTYYRQKNDNDSYINSLTEQVKETERLSGISSGQ